MEPIFDTARRLRRMRGECAGAAGQALLLAMAFTVLVTGLGFAAVLA